MSNKTQAQLTPWQGFKRYLKDEFPSQAKTFVAECPKILWAFLKDNFWPILMIAAFVWLNRIIPEPTEGFYKIYSLFAKLGFIVAILISLITPIFRVNIYEHPKYLFSSITRSLGWCATFIGMPLLLVRLSVEDIYTTYQESPQELIIFAIALSIFLFFITFGLHWRGRDVKVVARHSDMSSYAGMVKALNNRNAGADSAALERRKTVAIHEAGHALCYAALDPLPEEILLEIYDLGERTTGIVSAPSLFRFAPNVVQWKMLTCIAGMSAERLMTHKYVMGSSHDFMQWQKMAHLYLREQYEGVYVVEPKSTLDHAHNIDMQQKLLIKQLEQMRHFLEINSEVLNELSEAAISKGKLNKDELIPYLSKVQVPDGFPRIEASDWVKDDGSFGAFADGMPLQD